MATYVLVHGAWSGAHNFRKVRPLLREHGHEVFTPSLTGIGERVHLVSPLVDLTTHVHDVVNQILFEDLRDIVLLGFSYGGAVVTGSLDHVGDRVRHLVYLDAFVPRDGESVGWAPGRIDVGADWLVPPFPREFEDPAEAAFANPRRVPHPRRCFTEPVRLSRPVEDHPFPLTYVKATAVGPDDVFWPFAERARARPDRWRYREIDTNHMIPNNRPKELAELLLELAG